MADNTSTFVGNLTADPELRFTQGGLAVANFTVAVQDRKYDKDKAEYVDGDTLYIRASIWRDYAEHVAASLFKGTRVVVTGKLKQRSYETAEGEKRQSIELEVDAIGPDLRYATASVTRAAKGRGAMAAGAQSQDEPWAATAPAATAGDTWTTPTLTDATPF
jgi:single-strand DNA-binding protein